MARKKSKRVPCPLCEKGQGISITTIVIAVLALIVLVVLIVIFTGQTGKFTKNVGETQTQSCPGNNWQDSCPLNTEPFYGVTDTTALREHAGKTCCIPTKKVP